MLKKITANFSARILRAAVGRVATDLELTRSLQASFSSGALIDHLMPQAKACRSRLGVMEVAYNTEKLEGFICELGVYRGESLNAIAKHFSPIEIYGFDTFTGLPEY